MSRGRKAPPHPTARQHTNGRQHTSGPAATSSTEAAPKPARTKLTNAERAARAKAKADAQARQYDLLRTRAIADDARSLVGRDKKTARALANEANALAVLAGQLAENDRALADMFVAAFDASTIDASHSAIDDFLTDLRAGGYSFTAIRNRVQASVDSLQSDDPEIKAAAEALAESGTEVRR